MKLKMIKIILLLCLITISCTKIENNSKNKDNIEIIVQNCARNSMNLAVDRTIYADQAMEHIVAKAERHANALSAEVNK